MVPNNLKSRNTWVLWKWYNLKKVPYSPYTFKAASVTNCHDWSSYDFANSRKASFDGLGLVLDGTENLIAIDLDRTSVAEAQELITKLNSYTEITVSGKGLRIFVYADNPLAQGNRKGNIEVYRDKRYLTFSGNTVNACEVQERSEVFNEWYSSIFVPKVKVDLFPEVNYPSTSDKVLLERIFRYDKFSTLQQRRYNGEQLDIDNKDISKGDFMLALCFFRWSKSKEVTSRLMLSSKRVREKWFSNRGSETWLNYLVNAVSTY